MADGSNEVSSCFIHPADQSAVTVLHLAWIPAMGEGEMLIPLHLLAIDYADDPSAHRLISRS